MRKFFLVLLTLALVSEASALDLKFMFGGSFSHYKILPEFLFSPFFGDDYTHETSLKSGFLFGTGIEFALSKKLAIECDALYFQKGSIFQRVYPLSGVREPAEDLNLNAISILSLIKFRFFSGSSPYVLAGNELSYVFNNVKSAFQTITPYPEMDAFNIEGSFDYGLVFGAGVEMKEKIFTFFLEGRYHLGLGNIVKETVDWESVKTRAIAFVFGLKFE